MVGHSKIGRTFPEQRNSEERCRSCSGFYGVRIHLKTNAIPGVRPGQRDGGTGSSVGSRSLASQTPETRLDSFVLVSDSPVRIGGFCRAGELPKMIEDIDLPSPGIIAGNGTYLACPS